MTARLNGSTLHQRRIAASISLNHAADILGVGILTLQRIESGDTDAARAISVDRLLHYADTLGCAPADLFETTTNAATEPTDEAIDPQLLIALLQEHRTQVATKDLATLFNTSNTNIRTAAEQAEHLLSNTGLRLGRTEDRYFLTATRQEETQTLVTALGTATTARAGIDNGRARILKKVLDGQLGHGRQSTYTKTSLVLLTRLGMITTNGRHYAPSEALIYALDV
jgi:transcriptional regulator with XRE-family HTH domain